MTIGQHLSSAFFQLLVTLLFSLVVYGVYRLIFRNNPNHPSFARYIGIQPPTSQLDNIFLLIFLGLIAFGVVSTFLQFSYSDTLRELMLNDSSPYGKILKEGFNFSTMAAGLIYCFIQASASEEVLFRGLLAKRLYSFFGFSKGNLIQALLFWLMHLAIFRLITGEWVSAVQLLAFVTSFGLGLVFGYVNFRRGGESIAPSWILHGAVNFASFVTLGLLISR